MRHSNQWHTKDIIIHTILLCFIVFIIFSICQKPYNYFSKTQLEEWMSPKNENNNVVDIDLELIQLKDILVQLEDISGTWCLRNSKFSFYIELKKIEEQKYFANIGVNYANQSLVVYRTVTYENGILYLNSPIREPLTNQSFSILYTINTEHKYSMIPSVFINWFLAVPNSDSKLLLRYNCQKEVTHPVNSGNGQKLDQ
jgi:hypothetical protein